MPLPPKPPEARQRRNATGLDSLGSAPTPAVVPEPAPEWPAHVREDWASLWESPLAAHFLPTDLPALRRLHTLRAQLAAAEELLADLPYIEGSQGQQRRNPIAGELAPLRAEIRQLEDRYGLSPMARLRLGVTLGEAARSLEDTLQGLSL